MPGKWNSLDAQDLEVNHLYVGGKTIGDEPIQSLLPVGNSGGFRKATRKGRKLPYLVALFTTRKVSEWPDSINQLVGRVEYWGDNKDARLDMHDTPRRGNKLLRDTFRLLRIGDRAAIPPFFLFENAGSNRDVFFRGLLVPGSNEASETGHLEVVDAERDGVKFQNYRATFTILNVPTISRHWISELRSGAQPSTYAPAPFTSWTSGAAPDPWTQGEGQ